MPKTVTIGNFTARVEMIGAWNYNEILDETHVFSRDGVRSFAVQGDHRGALDVALAAEPEFASLVSLPSEGG